MDERAAEQSGFPSIRRAGQGDAEPALVPRRQHGRIPLTHSQQWWWNFLNLAIRFGTRTISTALRLNGPLNVERLIHSFDRIVASQESLRTRVVAIDGIPYQVVDRPIGRALLVTDLTGVPESSRETEARRIADAILRERYDVASGPLFIARLITLAAEDHVLVIGMDHIVADGASLGILLRDVWGCYAQLVRREDPALPPIAVQFADYALWQQDTRDAWAKRHQSFWDERIGNAGRIRLCADEGPVGDLGIPATRTLVHLGERVSAQLRERSRAERTTLAMATLTAYVACLLRWCDVTELVIGFTSMARLRPEVKNTIGSFGALLFLRVELHSQDTFQDLLARVTWEHALAYQHADAGRIAVQAPRPAFLWNPRFNWLLKGFGVDPADANEACDVAGVPGLSQRRFETAPRDDIERGGGLELLISDTRRGLSGAVWYRADRPAVAERFANDLHRFAATLALTPEKSVSEVVMDSR